MGRSLVKTVFSIGDFFLPPLQGPRLLTYHQVGSGLNRQMEVTEANFVYQIDWLRSNGRVVALDEAVSGGGGPGSSEMYVLTFDDGYRDMYTHAYPHLVARRLPFVLYLTTKPVDSGQPLSRPEALPLTWSQVNEMLSSGLMTLGAHTHTHPDLRFLTRGAVRDEIRKCDNSIERETGVHPVHFAYPWGYWSESADEAVRENYKTAALGGVVKSDPWYDQHLLPRLPVQKSDGHYLFRSRVRRGLRYEELIRRRLRKYQGP